MAHPCFRGHEMRYCPVDPDRSPEVAKVLALQGFVVDPGVWWCPTCNPELAAKYGPRPQTKFDADMERLFGPRPADPPAPKQEAKERPMLCVWQPSRRSSMLHAKREGEPGTTVCGIKRSRITGYWETEWQEPECRTCRRILGYGPVRVPLG